MIRVFDRGAADSAGSGRPGVLLHTATFSPEGTTTLLYVVDELTPDLELDPGMALELSGQASKVAIIDTTNDTVVYDEQSRCGYLSWTARDAAKNIYFVSHTYVAIQIEAGLAGDPTFAPCMVRILSGADGFDPDYYVDLQEIAGRPVGALMSGADGIAYTLVYSESATPITADEVDAAYGTPGWEHHIDGLAAMGCETVALQVAADNAAAIACYRNIGFRFRGIALQARCERVQD